MPLTIKPPRRPSTTAQTPSGSASPSSRQAYSEDREYSPEAPPASPLTPVVQPAKPVAFSQAAYAPDLIEPALNGHQAAPYYGHNALHPVPPVQVIEQPPPQPFSGDDSTDAIALRAAISSLQFQRETAQQHLRALEEIKRQAVQYPDAFRQHVLVQGGLRSAAQKPSLQQLLSQEHNHDDDEESDEADTMTGAEREPTLTGNTHTNVQIMNPEVVPDLQQLPGQVSSFGSRARSSNPQQPLKQQAPQAPVFPPIPEPQEVVRCPPIEWAKYNIVGESLDKLHRQQQLHPGNEGANGRDSTVAARYDPFLDTFTVEDQRSGLWTEDRKDSAASATEQPVQRRRSSKAFVHG